MAPKKISGYVKSENVIWFVLVALLVGFLGGVAFGIYKSGTIADPHQSHAPDATDATDAQNQQMIDALKDKTAQDPQDADAWIQLGHRYFDAGRAEEAIQAYEKALAIQPDNADVWTDLGVMYRRSDNPQKALEAFDKAMQIDAAHEISRFNKGVVLFHDLKDEAAALAAWESLLAINPQAKSPSGQTVRELVDHIKSGHEEGK